MNDAVSFEAIKISMRQDKDGWVLNLRIHPDDVPDTLIREWSGQRYMVALCAMNDEPIGQSSTQKVPDGPQHAVRYAAELCRHPDFQVWAAVTNEEQASQFLRGWLKISSRRELATNAEARKEFYRLVQQYLTGTPFG